jgi:hypothetical protein
VTWSVIGAAAGRETVGRDLSRPTDRVVSDRDDVPAKAAYRGWLPQLSTNAMPMRLTPRSNRSPSDTAPVSRFTVWKVEVELTLSAA